MPALVTCPRCGLRGELPDDRLGTLIGCPKCKAEFAAPTAPDPGPSDPQDELAVWVGKGPPPTQPADPPHPAGLAPGRGLPPEVTPENAASQLAWVRAEVGRFQSYVSVQLDMLRRRREELARMESDAAAAFVLRDQELNREKVALDARAVALDAREQRLSEAEQKLDRRLAEAAELEETLRAELEEQEVEVQRQRRELDELAREARARVVTPPQVPVPAPRPAAPDLLDSWLA